MENENEMLKILKLLHDLGPWDDSPLLLAHAQRFVPKSSFFHNFLAGIASLTIWWRFLESLRSPFSTILNLQETLKKVFCCWALKIAFILFFSRLYEKFGETALRPLIKFHPSILPSDIKQLCRNDPAHFLAYLDSLVKSKPEDERWEKCRILFICLLSSSCSCVQVYWFLLGLFLLLFWLLVTIFWFCICLLGVVKH